jgi:hypothetical protein
MKRREFITLTGSDGVLLCEGSPCEASLSL